MIVADLALEAEFTRTAEEGETRGGSDIEVDTNALYLTFTTPGPVYLKLRGGLIDITADVGSASDDESGESFGAGLGLSLGLLRLELEYTRIDDDIDFLSAGIVF